MFPTFTRFITKGISKILFLRRSDRKFMVVCFCTDNKIKITESWLKGKHFVAILCPNLDFILLSLWSTLVSFPSLCKQKEVSINLLVKDLTELIYWACCILLECSLFTYCLRSCFFLFWITCVCTTFSHENINIKHLCYSKNLEVVLISFMYGLLA